MFLTMLAKPEEGCNAGDKVAVFSFIPVLFLTDLLPEFLSNGKLLSEILLLSVHAQCN